MTSFTSSFKQTVFAPEHRFRYGIISTAMVLTLIIVTVGCSIWLRRSLKMELAYAATLTDKSEVLVVGSSHLFGIRPVRDGVPATNLSHRANSLEMIGCTVRSAIEKGNKIDTVIFEVGFLVAGADPMQIRDHGFRELGIASWDLPGTPLGKVRHTVNAFPPLRVPRLNPETILKRMHPELGVEAEGFQVEKTSTFSDNVDYRIHAIETVLDEKNENRIELNRTAMLSLIQDLKELEITTVVLVTPHDEAFQNQITAQQQRILNGFLDDARLAGVDKVLNHYSDPKTTDRKWLTDADHLNKEGQVRLNKMLATELGWSE